jgi:type I restriction enzyme M protein
MEACIVICRTYKAPDRRGKILFINAVNEVTRKNAQSYLEDKHIARIAGAYAAYSDEQNFARVVTIADTEQYGYSLSIPLYVRTESDTVSTTDYSLSECLELWNESRNDMRTAYAGLKDILTELAGDNNGES